MSITYDAVGEIDRLTNGRKMMRPRPARGKGGRWERDHGAQWDWYYELVDPSERAYLSSHFMADMGFSPDEIDLDAWLQMVRLARKAEFDPLADDYMAADAPEISEVDSGEIVGPQEVAELLCVEVGTVHQWRKRDLLPEPFQVVSKVPLWRLGEITTWAESCGRL